MTLPLAGQPGHGRMAFLRRQPVRIVGGRTEGGYTSEFELICPSCGDLRPWITPKSSRGFKGSAGLARHRRPWQRMTSISGRTRTEPGTQVPAMSKSAPQARPAETASGYRHEALPYPGMARRAVAAGRWPGMTAQRAGGPS
jgi:hypothetical protein